MKCYLPLRAEWLNSQGFVLGRGKNNQLLNISVSVWSLFEYQWCYKNTIKQGCKLVVWSDWPQAWVHVLGGRGGGRLGNCCAVFKQLCRTRVFTYYSHKNLYFSILKKKDLDFKGMHTLVMVETRSCGERQKSEWSQIQRPKSVHGNHSEVTKRAHEWGCHGDCTVQWQSPYNAGDGCIPYNDMQPIQEEILQNLRTEWFLKWAIFPTSGTVYVYIYI